MDGQAFLPTQQKCETQTLLEPALRKAEHMASNAPQHNPSNLSFWIWLGRPIRPLYKYYVTPAKFFLRLTPAVSYRLFPSIDHSEASQTSQPANIAGHFTGSGVKLQVCFQGRNVFLPCSIIVKDDPGFWFVLLPNAGWSSLILNRPSVSRTAFPLLRTPFQVPVARTA